MNWIFTVRLFPSPPILYNSGTKRPDTHMKEIKNWKSEPTSPLSRLTILRMPCRPSPPYMFVVAWAETAHVPLLTMNSLGFDSNHCSVVLLTHCYASAGADHKIDITKRNIKKKHARSFYWNEHTAKKSGILLVAYQRARFFDGQSTKCCINYDIWYISALSPEQSDADLEIVSESLFSGTGPFWHRFWSLGPPRLYTRSDLFNTLNNTILAD